MTDPDLVFDMDPENIRRVEQWIAGRWPDTPLAKHADGARLTWSLQGAGGSIASVVATESFLCLPAGEVAAHLNEARRVCESQPPDAGRHLLLATDGVQAVDGF